MNTKEKIGRENRRPKAEQANHITLNHERQHNVEVVDLGDSISALKYLSAETGKTHDEILNWNWGWEKMQLAYAVDYCDAIEYFRRLDSVDAVFEITLEPIPGEEDYEPDFGDDYFEAQREEGLL